MGRRRSAASAVADKVKDRGAVAQSHVGGVVQDLVQRATPVAQSVVEKATPIMHDLAEKAGALAEKAGPATQRAAEAAMPVAQRAAGTAAEALAGAAERLAQVSVEHGTPAAEAARERLADALEATASQVRPKRKRHRVRAAILLAFGAALAWLAVSKGGLVARCRGLLPGRGGNDGGGDGPPERDEPPIPVPTPQLEATVEGTPVEGPGGEGGTVAAEDNGLAAPVHAGDAGQSGAAPG